MLELNKIHQGDCLELMKSIDNKSIDMILCDLPYGTTTCEWDSKINLDELWGEYNRIKKDNAPVLLFGKEPFSSELRFSNLKNYRYDIYWHKTMCSNFMLGKKQPFFKIETISVFYKKQPVYNPIMRKGKPYFRNQSGVRYHTQQKSLNGILEISRCNPSGLRFPDNLIEFSNANNKNIHPTQKPVELCEYLIKTYSNEGDLILDNCCGSGTTCLAAKNTGRNFIGIEKEKEYVEMSNTRLNILY